MGVTLEAAFGGPSEPSPGAGTLVSGLEAGSPGIMGEGAAGASDALASSEFDSSASKGSLS